MIKDSHIPLDRLAFSSLVILFPSLIFSYLPVITLGTIGGVHIDLSLLYVLMSIVIILHLPFLLFSLPKLLRSLGWRFLICLTGYTWLSAIWSPNHTRAIITASFITALLLLSSIVALRLPDLLKKKKLLLRLSLWAFVASSLLALWQIVADALSTPSSLTGLPQMYSGEVFGIARPTAFALEPQFFGSLLLIPLVWSAWHVFTQSAKMMHGIIFGASTLLLLLTLSRGALLAAFVGLIILAVVVRPTLKPVAHTLIIVFVAILLSVATTYIVGSIRSDNISGSGAVKRSISQLSLGVINFAAPSPSTKASLPKPAASQTSGYVPSSTNSRLSMSTTALTIWKTTPQIVLFGVGIGGFGASLTPSQPGTVVNNYYLELLVETGIFGTLLFLSFVTLLFWYLIRQKNWPLLALTAALLVQMNFFSGNANIIHIWVVIGIVIGISLHKKQVPYNTRFVVQ